MSHHKPDPNKSISLTIDGLPVTVPEGTTILEAARTANVHIPTLCDHPGLGRRAVCRLCVVECDGRGKLLAACANEVWEGVKVVTGNIRILNIRKTIVELLLAGHPQDCLSCVRNGKCELQSLAAQFGIREQTLQRGDTDQRSVQEDAETLVRDMNKCVKCGRCVEVCQELQSVRAINTARRSTAYEICAPYGQALGEGPCVFCGRCAAVCPVGAIYEYDQTAEVWAALGNSEGRVAIQIAPQAGTALDAEFGLPPGTVTAGKLIGALRRLGFDKVLDAGIFASIARQGMGAELLLRHKSDKLPMISACSPGSINFVKNFFPDLADHLSASKTPLRIFGDMARTWYSRNSGPDPAAVTTVSVTPCIAHKYEARQSDMPDIALTTRELARMITLAGIDIKALPESPFDNIPGVSPGIEAVASGGMEVITVKGLANARTVLDSIRRGECKAALVEIMSCGNCDRDGLHPQLTG